MRKLRGDNKLEPETIQATNEYEVDERLALYLQHTKADPVFIYLQRSTFRNEDVKVEGGGTTLTMNYSRERKRRKSVLFPESKRLL